MDTFVARQPIFDTDQNVYAYELLFRSSMQNTFLPPEEGGASFRLIADSALVVPLETLARGKRVFVNASRDILLGDFLTLLPRESTVVEVLETVRPDDEVIAACRKLKKQGYDLALDGPEGRVWTWSAVRSFIQVVSTQTLEPGDAYEFREAFVLRDELVRVGSTYVLTGYLAVSSEDPQSLTMGETAVEAKFVIGIGPGGGPPGRWRSF